MQFTDSTGGVGDLTQAIRLGGELSRLFQRAVRQQGRTARRIGRGRWNGLKVRRLLDDARQRVIRETATMSQAPRRECRGAGCDACCRSLMVDITPLEALVVGDFLTTRCSEPELSAIRLRLAANEERAGANRYDPSRQKPIRCALLGERAGCGVYPVRPLVCAGSYSLSRAACQNAAAKFAEINGQIPLDRSAKAWLMGISNALQRTLVASRLDANLYELNSAVLRVLNCPGAMKRWLCHEDIFGDCLCTDAHSPPRKAPRQRRIDSPHQAVGRGNLTSRLTATHSTQRRASARIR